MSLVLYLAKCKYTEREEPDHTHNSIILRLKDTHFQSSVDWQLEDYNPTKTTQFPKGQVHTTPLWPHKSSPHFLHGQSNTTPSQPHPLHTFVAVPLAPQSTQSHHCRLHHQLSWAHL